MVYDWVSRGLIYKVSKTARVTSKVSKNANLISNGPADGVSQRVLDLLLRTQAFQTLKPTVVTRLYIKLSQRDINFTIKVVSEGISFGMIDDVAVQQIVSQRHQIGSKSATLTSK